MYCNHCSIVPFVRYTARLLAKQYLIKHIDIRYYVEQESNGVGMSIKTKHKANLDLLTLYKLIAVCQGNSSM